MHIVFEKWNDVILPINSFNDTYVQLSFTWLESDYKEVLLSHLKGINEYVG